MKQETLLGCGVVVLAAGIVGVVGLMQMRRSADGDDADRMRQLYVALASYEQSYDEVPAASLPDARPYLDGTAAFVAKRDPFRSVSSLRFPADAGRPDAPASCPFRVSFTYLWSFPGATNHRYSSFRAAERDPRLGLIADEWLGSVTPKNPFHAQVAGPILRVDTDGSLIRLPDRGGPKPLGDVEDLFFRR